MFPKSNFSPKTCSSPPLNLSPARSITCLRTCKLQQAPFIPLSLNRSSSHLNSLSFCSFHFFFFLFFFLSFLSLRSQFKNLTTSFLLATALSRYLIPERASLFRVVLNMQQPLNLLNTCHCKIHKVGSWYSQSIPLKWANGGTIPQIRSHKPVSIRLYPCA